MTSKKKKYDTDFQNYNKGIDKTDTSKFFEFPLSSTRGHKCKLQKKSCRLDVRKYIFSNRVVNNWNSLRNNVVDSETVNQFKDRLDGHWKNLPENFNPSLPKDKSLWYILMKTGCTDI